MHISRISRENEKWFCETFLARNAAREIAGKTDHFLANFWQFWTPIWPKFNINFHGRLNLTKLKVLPFISYDFLTF